MRIQTVVRGLEAPTHIANYARERLRDALRRHRSQVALVSVRIEDINGPRGGVDKSCYIFIEGRFGAVVVRELAEDEFAAIERASDRAVRNLVRTLERSRRGAAVASSNWGLA